MTRRYEILINTDVKRHVPALPEGYEWHSLENDYLLGKLAEVTSRAFQGTVDAKVWPMLASEQGLRDWFEELGDRLRRDSTGVVMCGDEPAGGIVATQEWPKVGELWAVCVAPGHRGPPIGTHLIRHAEDFYHQRGIPFVKSMVAVEQPRLLNWYQRLGYVVMAEKWLEPQRPKGLKGVVRKIQRVATGA